MTGNKILVFTRPGHWLALKGRTVQELIILRIQSVEVPELLITECKCKGIIYERKHIMKAPTEMEW